MTKWSCSPSREPAGGRQWTLLLDINLAGDPQKEDFAIGHCYNAAGRSFLAFRVAGGGVVQLAPSRREQNRHRQIGKQLPRRHPAVLNGHGAVSQQFPQRCSLQAGRYRHGVVGRRVGTL